MRRWPNIIVPFTGTTSATPPTTPDHVPPDSSTPAALTSSDSSDAASDHQRSEAAPSPSPSTRLSPYATDDASSTQSSPGPAHHAAVAPEIFRPRSAIPSSSSGSSCNVSDSSSGMREGFARRRPPPRPLDPMRPHGRSFFPPFSVAIQTDRHHPALLQAFLGRSYSHTALHSSDTTGTQGLQVASAPLGGPYIPRQESESGSRPTSSSDRSSRPVLRDVRSFLHPSSVVAAHASLQSPDRRTVEDAPESSIPNPVSLSSGRHAAAPWLDPVDTSRRPSTPPRRL
ncbi:hypothetical protein GSI_07905 [Ganoderma sinense ZZ0214-1]|uniref:Uncharacterized protein n=1 Tax=Ganoderma sinense ZZ0214-1 TaxID=1077348 RepID=A0A2G8S8C8_9APHY|nr:hypothetical protein GSI_07905 [Ganoderma sinense ZZ0214-1]